MNFAYLGTDAFAAAVLGNLVEAGRAPALVVTRPDSRRGRGRKPGPPPTAVAAAELGLELIQPERADGPELEAALKAAEPDLLCLCAYGAIIREPLLSEHLILNLHPSMLPRWRGAAPIERALMEGDARTGVSIIRLVEELDAGPVALSEPLPIESDDDFGSLSAKLVTLGSRLLLEAFDRFERGALEFREQDDEGILYAERIEAADRLLDPSDSATALERRVRALRPHIGARLELPSGEVIGIRGASLGSLALEPGAIVEAAGRIELGCTTGSLAIERVVPAGGREMPVADWLRGRPRLA